MHVVSRKPVVRQSELASVRAHQRECRLCRFLHPLAELAGDREASFARVRLGLDEEHVTSRRRVRETGRDARSRRPPPHLARVAPCPEPRADSAFVDTDLPLESLRYLA